MKLRLSVEWMLLSLMVCLALNTAAWARDVRDQFFASDQLRTLIITGRSNHDWRHSSTFLKELLHRTGRFTVRVIEEPSGISAHTLAPYDLLVFDYQGPRLGGETETAILDFVSSGKGCVIFHGASYAFSGLDVLADSHRRTGIVEEPWTEYLALSGGIWSEGAPLTGHGAIHSFEVVFNDREHPITSGLGKSFVATDELYHDLKMHASVRVLAEAFSDPETKGTGEKEPVLWVLSYGMGRVFHTTLGHDATALAEPGFQITFVRGCEWAASGEVTLSEHSMDDSAAASRPRVLVVTGGHSYDTEFYTLFDGDWLDWSHALSNAEAFENDIKDKYDVVLLYDMSRELSDEGRDYLRNYLESGRGLLVVHHALADYNTWEWWWRDVVGGKYILEGTEDVKGSTYQHDVELFIRPAEKHPITLNLGPMHFVDETYKNMWISEEASVLLEVDEETSDGPVAWISPYPKSRVAVIQLGHDKHAFMNPGYRELIRRSILWAANRLE